ncbi:MAG: hypothetical protein GF331_20925, partial [Chitinivibrionales bacterium]|nr:hypothetical protein [Chitinivibrionales bacterium]
MRRCAVVVLAAFGLFLIGCGEDDSVPSGPVATSQTGSAEGSIYIDVSSMGGGSASGTVTVVLGQTSVDIAVDQT